MPGRASFLSYGLHSFWWQALRVERNHQDICYAFIPPWSLKSYLQPCPALRIQASQKYCPWNLWWKYHHTSYLAFDNAPIRDWISLRLTTITFLHYGIQHINLRDVMCNDCAQLHHLYIKSQDHCIKRDIWRLLSFAYIGMLEHWWNYWASTILA